MRDATTIASLSLGDLVSGQSARIVRLRSSQPILRHRLLEMGIMRGETLRVERHAPFGDPVEISVKGYQLALRLSEARDIEVELI